MRQSRNTLFAALILSAVLGGRVTAAPPVEIVVEAVYPGANATVVADTVAAPIEQQVNGVEGMRRMWSRCGNDGSYTLTISFPRNTDLDLMQVLVQNRVSLAVPVLPDVVKQTGVTVKKKPAGILAIIPLLSSDRRFDTLYLSNYARLRLKDDLARVSGVGDVRLLGQRETCVRVWVDKAKLLRWGLTAADLVKALKGQNLQVEVGRHSRGELVISIAVPPKGGLLDLTDKLGDIVVKKKGSDSPLIRLKTIARLELGAKGAESSVSLDGKPAVAVVVYLAQKARPGKVSAALKERLSKLREDLPRGCDFGRDFDFTANLEAPDKANTPAFLLADIAPPEGASFERVVKAADRCAALLRQTRGVGHVLTLVGDNPFDCAHDRAWLLASVAPSVKGRDGKEQILKDARRRLQEVRGVRVGLRDFSLGACPLEMLVSGPDRSRVKQLARKLAERLRRTTAVTEVRGSAEERRKGIVVEIDRTAATRLGVKLSDITTTVEACVGKSPGKDFQGHGRVRELHFSADLTEQDVKDIRQLKVRNSEGKMVPLGTVVSLSVREMDPFVYRFDIQPAERITADLAPGVSPAVARKVCDKAAEEVRKGLKLSPGYRVSWLRPGD